MTLAISLRLALQSRASLAAPSDGLPTNALTLNGQALTLNGQTLTLGA